MSLQIQTQKANTDVTLALSGRIDTTTAPQLEEALDAALTDARALIFDFSQVEYISSAGLRVILKAQKAMKTRGTMKLTHVNDAVMEVFDITGFLDFLTVE